MPQRRDWSHLLPEFLEKIAGNLTEIPDRVRFGAVCVPWRSASKSINHPQQFPWILLPTDPVKETDDHHFFSLSENRVYKLHLPDSRGKQIFGSSHGWLITTDDVTRSISLLNPLTGAQISLPPLTPDVIRIDLGKLIKSDSDNGSYVMVSVWPGPSLFFCLPGDRAWRKIYTSQCCFLSDFTYYRGSFYVLKSSGKTATVDPLTLKKASKVPSVIGYPCSFYLVESSSGELLMVVRDEDCEGIRAERFEVFQLDQSEQPKWFKVRSIGDDMLFVDDRHAMSFVASNFNGCRANCIYFVDRYDISDSISGGEDVCYVRLFDIEDGRVEQLPYYWDNFPKGGRGGAWVVPGL